MKGNNGYRWVLWSLSGHSMLHGQQAGPQRLQSDSRFTSLAADRWSETKMTMKKQYMVYITMMNVCMIWEKKQKDKPVLALRWICYHLICSLVATFIDYLKPRKACFIQLFVFTRYRCGSQVLLAYKRLKWRQKNRNVETLRPSFYRSNIKYNCNLLFFDKRCVDSSLLFYQFLYFCS